jgi:GGDEF domain-containing protein
MTQQTTAQRYTRHRDPLTQHHNRPTYTSKLQQSIQQQLLLQPAAAAAATTAAAP